MGDEETRHTPGPWRVVRRGMLYGGFDIWYPPDIEVDDDADDCNARLIAAAPEMLEALQAVADHRTMQMPEGMWVMVLDIICKATGKETP